MVEGSPVERVVFEWGKRTRPVLFRRLRDYVEEDARRYGTGGVGAEVLTELLHYLGDGGKLTLGDFSYDILDYPGRGDDHLARLERRFDVRRNVHDFRLGGLFDLVPPRGQGFGFW